MSSIYLSGSLAYDHIMDLPGLFKDYFLPEKLHNINVSFVVPDHAEHAGGTAGNVAYNLALLGEKPQILATAGNDFDRYKKRLEAKGLSTYSIKLSTERPTSFAYIVTDKGDNQIAAFHPGAGEMAYGDVQFDDDAIVLISAGCLDDIRTFPDICRGFGSRFLFDPGQSIPALTADELRNGITDAHTVFANDYEFEMIKIKTGWNEGDVVKVANTLVITLGKDGSRVITKDGEARIRPVSVNAILDPTGAGDAYRAGYIKGMQIGFTTQQCAQLGSTTATYAIEHVGTQNHMFLPGDVASRYSNTYGETIAL